jgi:transposase-like protein
MNQSERRHFSGEEKVKILRLHLLEGKAVSDLCEQFKINPSLFYQWQRSFFENGARAFEGSGPARSESKLEKQVEALEARLQRHCKDWPCAQVASVSLTKGATRFMSERKCLTTGTWQRSRPLILSVLDSEDGYGMEIDFGKGREPTWSYGHEYKAF